MSEVMEIDENDCNLKTATVGTGDEFFDAVDDVSAIKDENDLLKQLDVAIANEKPSVKPAMEDDPVSTPSVVANGDNDSNDSNKKVVNGISDEAELLGETPLETSLEENLDGEDVDKLEDDLLKDDDDPNDLESVEKEAEDLLGTAYDDEAILDNELESNPTESVPTEKVPEQTNDKMESATEAQEIAEEKTEPAATEDITEPEKTANITEPEPVIDDQMLATEEPVEVESAAEEPEVEPTAPSDEKSAAEESKISSIDAEAQEEIQSSEKLEEPIEATPTPLESGETPEDESKGDDLLVACESPRATQTLPEQDQQDNESVGSSSTPDETPDESSDEKAAASVEPLGDQQQESEATQADTNEKEPEAMDVDELPMPSVKENDAKVEEDEPEPRKVSTEFIPLKLKFVQHFSSTVGKLSRIELEELLLQKITESIMFCSENTELRSRLEKQEKLCENFKKRLDNVKKQYNDLEMIHNRVMKDLKDRPDAPITPVKITRAVGLQVYQPTPRAKQTLLPPTPPIMSKPNNKRPMENDFINGSGTSPDNAKRKKTLKITPLRPPLSEVERAKLDAQEANEEAKLRTNVSKTVIGSSPGGVGLTPSVTMTPVRVDQNGSARKTPNTSQSIDLTDEDEGPSPSGKVVAPPALVAIRNSSQNAPQRTAYLLKTTPPGPASRQAQYRPSPVVAFSRHPAPLPLTPAQISKPGSKKIPPRPTIKINNVSSGIIVSWTVDNLSDEHADIQSYQIYAYEVTNSAPSSENWRHVGDVKALLLPMAVTLTQFQEGQKYYFAVRSVDIHRRLSHFSNPQTWHDSK